jgi:MFS family permease
VSRAFGMGRRRLDWGLLAGLGIIVSAAAVMRLINLGTNLPQILYPDEPAIVDGARALMEGDFTLPPFGWPPASMELTALSLIFVKTAAPSSVADVGGLYLFGRGLFVLVSLVAVLLTGVLGARLSDSGGDRRLIAWGAAAAMAVSYLSVRLGRQIHPDHLQMVFAIGSFLSILAYDRSRRWSWLVGAGLLAGLAGAAKYAGVLVAIPAAVSVLSPRRESQVLTSGVPISVSRASVWHLSLLGGSTVLGFLAGNIGALVDFDGFLAGVLWQARRNVTGHLGYEGSNVWWFHLSDSLPGNWGWPLTILALIGTGWVLRRGTRAQRLATSFMLPGFVLLGLFRVRFPHHMLLLTPFFAAMALVALKRVIELAVRGATPARSRFAGTSLGVAPPITLGVVTPVAGLLLMLLLVPTFLHDLRLIRASAAGDTRLLTDATVARLNGSVWAESYGLPSGSNPDVALSAFGDHPEVLECDCFAVISSYMEDRFRRLPERYREQVAVYDAMRAEGEMVAIIRPFVPLDYDWDVLPQWGLVNLPLRGKMGPTGPTLTVLNLRR